MIRFQFGCILPERRLVSTSRVSVVTCANRRSFSAAPEFVGSHLAPSRRCSEGRSAGLDLTATFPTPRQHQKAIAGTDD
jgi:hypothetical protein